MKSPWAVCMLFEITVEDDLVGAGVSVWRFSSYQRRWECACQTRLGMQRNGAVICKE